MEKIFIGNNSLERLCELFNFSQFSKVAILTDTNVAKHWLPTVKRSLKQKISKIIIKPGEKEKNIETAKKIWEKMLESGLDRHSLLINLGGGVITDLGGFVASTFMRGIDFINVPTTLLAMVDAAGGGKCGINFAGNKNIIGTFANPKKTIINVDFLQTLPDREFIAGFGEIIKHGIICDREYFDLVTSKKPREFSKYELKKIIKRSVEIKFAIVKADPKEKGLRKVLNFGHTVGHAIESLSFKTSKPLLHGEAVAIGMVAESKLAELLGILSNGDFQIIEKGIKKAGLPIRIPSNVIPAKAGIQKILKKIIHDKKNQGNRILWSLPKKIGEVGFNIEAPDKLVIEAIKYIQK